MTYIAAFFDILNEMSPYLLLGFLIAGVLHAFVPSAIYSRYLSGTGWRPVTAASLFGIPLPLCSCGVLPTAVSLRRSGASRAAATSFLIATPQTGVDSIMATYSMMGLPFAVLRPVAALVTALFGGLAVGAVERQSHESSEDEACATACESESLKPTLWGKIVEALRYGLLDMLESIGKWLVLGLVVATFITVLVPDDFFSTYAAHPIVNMFIILLVAIPMYICATGSIPIAAALMLKGMTPGCALVLLMAGPAANLASVLVISRAFGRRATVAYLSSIIFGALGFGILVDYWPGLRESFVAAMPHMACHSHGMTVNGFNTVCSIVLIALLVIAAVNYYRHNYSHKTNNTSTMRKFKVTGMSCGHCRARVENGIATLEGVTSVNVDLSSGIAVVDGSVADATIVGTVKALGYDATPIVE